MDICLKFGKRVRKARKSVGLSQEELAHEARSSNGLPKPWMSQWAAF